MKFQKLIKEYARSEDLYDVLSLIQAGQSVIMVCFDNGDLEFCDDEYYKEAGRELLNKTRGKKVAKIYKLSAEAMVG